MIYIIHIYIHTHMCVCVCVFVCELWLCTRTRTRTHTHTHTHAHTRTHARTRTHAVHVCNARVCVYSMGINMGVVRMLLDVMKNRDTYTISSAHLSNRQHLHLYQMLTTFFQHFCCWIEVHTHRSILESNSASTSTSTSTSE